MRVVHSHFYGFFYSQAHFLYSQKWPVGQLKTQGFVTLHFEKKRFSIIRWSKLSVVSILAILIHLSPLSEYIGLKVIHWN